MAHYDLCRETGSQQGGMRFVFFLTAGFLSGMDLHGNLLFDFIGFSHCCGGALSRQADHCGVCCRKMPDGQTGLVISFSAPLACVP